MSSEQPNNDGTMNSPPPAPSSGGLASSTPLVTLPQSGVVGTGIVRPPPTLAANTAQQPKTSNATTTTTTTKTTDHPLTFGFAGNEIPTVTSNPTQRVVSNIMPLAPPPPPPPSAAAKPQTVTGPGSATKRTTPSAMTAAPSLSAAMIPTIVSPPPKVTTPVNNSTNDRPTLVAVPPKPATPSHQQLHQNSNNNNNNTATTLDESADAFLSGPSYRTAAGQQEGSTTPVAPILKPSPLPDHETGLDRLHTLVERRAWGDVLQVTGETLRNASSPHASVYYSMLKKDNRDRNVDDNLQNLASSSEPTIVETLQNETVEILTLECHAWIKLRRYTDLAREVQHWSFTAADHNIYPQSNDNNNDDDDDDDDDDDNNTAEIEKNDNHIDNDDTPTWIPNHLRIFAAATLQYTDSNPKRCIDVLNKMRENFTAQEEENLELWLVCIDHTLCNAFQRQGEWRLALSALDNVLQNLSKATEQEINSRCLVQEGSKEYQWVKSNLTGAYRCEVYSRQGRMMLQVGALKEASQLFQAATKEWTDTTAIASSAPGGISDETQQKINDFLNARHVMSTLLMNDGLLCFAHPDYDQAIPYFSKAIDLQRAATATKYQLEEWIAGLDVVGADSNQTVLTDCCNNLALCSLYTCRMQEAVRIMESLIRDDPTSYLTEGLAFNLCTLYELGHEPAVSTHKKRVLQLIAKRFFLHDIGPESFRIG